MEFGIGIPTASDSWKLAQRAEEAGFSHAWFYDTQMITADCFTAMGAAAMKTSRIRLGTGVLVPSNRIAAVTALGSPATSTHLISPFALARTRTHARAHARKRTRTRAHAHT